MRSVVIDAIAPGRGSSAAEVRQSLTRLRLLCGNLLRAGFALIDPNAMSDRGLLRGMRLVADSDTWATLSQTWDRPGATDGLIAEPNVTDQSLVGIEWSAHPPLRHRMFVRPNEFPMYSREWQWLALRHVRSERVREGTSSDGVLSASDGPEPVAWLIVDLTDRGGAEPPAIEYSYALRRLPTFVAYLTLGRGSEDRVWRVLNIPTFGYPEERARLFSTLRDLSISRPREGFPRDQRPAASDEPSKPARALRPIEGDEPRWGGGDRTPAGPEPGLVGSPAPPARIRSADVHLGAAVPSSVRRGERFVARFMAYAEAYREQVQRVVDQEAPGSQRLLDLQLCRWRPGTRVTVRLAVDGGEVDNPVRSFKWNGRWEVTRFDVRVLPGAEAGTLILRFDVTVEFLPLATLRPEVEIRDAAPTRTVTRVIEQRAPRTAFASYARDDRRDVLGRVRSVQIFAGVDVFLDCLSMRPGDRWQVSLEQEIRTRDVFLLFWSRRASQSEWVEWEWRKALAAKSLDGIQPHPLEPSDVAPPPAELSALQFGALYELFVAQPREPWLVARARGLRCRLGMAWRTIARRDHQ